MKNYKLTILDICEIGIFIALALVLDMPIFKIKIVANGGSISFSLIPLFILSIRKRFIKGFVATGLIFGLIDCLIDGYGIITYPLDYLLGIGSVSILGLFSKQILDEKRKFTSYLICVCGVIVACFSRTIFSTISGMLIYKLNFKESLIYQLTYILPSMGITICVLLPLIRPLKILERKNNKRFINTQTK